jgi:hypothetical protein
VRQLSIFDAYREGGAKQSPGANCDPPRARREDPITSQLAAARVDEFSGEHFALIHKALEAPGTIYEIAERTGLSHVQVARRLPEMKGRAQRSGQKKPGPTGRACEVWKRMT